MKFLHNVSEHPSWSSRAKIDAFSEEKAVAILDGLCALPLNDNGDSSGRPATVQPKGHGGQSGGDGDHHGSV
jgi:hypothetical protein